MSRWFDSGNDPNAIEAIMTKGDQYAYRLNPPPPSPPFPPTPTTYTRGAFGWVIPYEWPEYHPDYHVGNPLFNPNYHRSIIKVTDELADVLYSLQITINVAGLDIQVTLPAVSTPGKPADWPIQLQLQAMAAKV